MTTSSRFAITSLLLLALIAPLGARAAEPSLTLRGLEGRTLTIRYADMDGARLELVDAMGAVVKGDMRFSENRGTKTIQLPRGIKGGKYTLVAKDRDGVVLDTLKLTLTYAAPTCSIRASEKTIEGKGMVSLRWKSENAQKAMLFGAKKVRPSGSERVLLSHAGTHGFALNVTGPGGVGSCSTKVTVE